jgi:hypothetical protein
MCLSLLIFFLQNIVYLLNIYLDIIILLLLSLLLFKDPGGSMS